MPNRTRGVRGKGARDAKPHEGSKRPGRFEWKRPFVCGSESGAEKSIQIMREKVFSKKAFSMYDRLVPSFP